LSQTRDQGQPLGVIPTHREREVEKAVKIVCGLTHQAISVMLKYITETKGPHGSFKVHRWASQNNQVVTLETEFADP
jgi:hypothetical protein